MRVHASKLSIVHTCYVVDDPCIKVIGHVSKFFCVAWIVCIGLRVGFSASTHGWFRMLYVALAISTCAMGPSKVC